MGLPPNDGNGEPIVRAKTNPRARATGGDPSGLRQNKIRIMKRAFCQDIQLFCFALIRDRFLRGLYGLCIAEVIAFQRF